MASKKVSLKEKRQWGEYLNEVKNYQTFLKELRKRVPRNNRKQEIIAYVKKKQDEEYALMTWWHLYLSLGRNKKRFNNMMTTQRIKGLCKKKIDNYIKNKNMASSTVPHRMSINLGPVPNSPNFTNFLPPAPPMLTSANIRMLNPSPRTRAEAEQNKLLLNAFNGSEANNNTSTSNTKKKSTNTKKKSTNTKKKSTNTKKKK